MAIRTAITMVYLTISLLPWRLVSPADDDDKTANLKAIGRKMSNRAFKLVGWPKGFNFSPHLLLTNKYFHRNKEATTMVGKVAAILARVAK